MSWREITDAVIKYVTKNTPPVSVVEMPSLKGLNKTHAAKYDLLRLNFYPSKIAARVVHFRGGNPDPTWFDETDAKVIVANTLMAT